MKYGNCLLAAIIAKLKDPKNIKIIYIPKKLNSGGNYRCHFLWENTKENKVFHYIPEADGVVPLFYKGKTKCLSSRAFQSLMYRSVLEYTQREHKKYAKAFNVDFENELSWHFIELEGLPRDVNLPKCIIMPYIQVLYGKHPDWKTKMVPIDQMSKLPKSSVAWRYQTPYTELFNYMWNND